MFKKSKPAKRSFLSKIRPGRKTTLALSVGAIAGTVGLKKRGAKPVDLNVHTSI